MDRFSIARLDVYSLHPLIQMQLPALSGAWQIYCVRARRGNSWADVLEATRDGDASPVTVICQEFTPNCIPDFIWPGGKGPPCKEAEVAAVVALKRWNWDDERSLRRLLDATAEGSLLQPATLAPAALETAPSAQKRLLCAIAEHEFRPTPVALPAARDVPKEVVGSGDLPSGRISTGRTAIQVEDPATTQVSTVPSHKRRANDAGFGDEVGEVLKQQRQSEPEPVEFQSVGVASAPPQAKRWLTASLHPSKCTCANLFPHNFRELLRCPIHPAKLSGDGSSTEVSAPLLDGTFEARASTPLPADVPVPTEVARRRYAKKGKGHLQGSTSTMQLSD